MRISDWSSDVCSSDLLLSPSMAGAMQFALDNSGGEYDPDDEIAAGQRARWTATDPTTSIAHPLFTGILDEPEQAPASGRQHMVNVSVLGMLSTLVGKRVETLPYEDIRSEEHTSELQSLMPNSYAVFRLKKK